MTGGVALCLNRDNSCLFTGRLSKLGQERMLPELGKYMIELKPSLMQKIHGNLCVHSHLKNVRLYCIIFYLKAV